MSKKTAKILIGKYTVSIVDPAFTKRIRLDKDTLRKKNPFWSGGTYETLELSSLREWHDELKRNDNRVGYSLGIYPKAKGEVDCLTQATYKKTPGAIYKGNEFIKPVSLPNHGLVLLDHDGSLTPTAFDAAMARAWPEWAMTGWVRTMSTSAGVYHPDGRELKGVSTGHHTYAVLDDHAKLVEFSDWLLRRLWLAGYGHIFITASGIPYIRSIVDHAVFEPARSIFEGGAILEGGLKQVRPPVEYSQGGIIVFKDLKPITDEEEAEFRALVAKEKERLQPEIEETRNKWRKDRESELAARGVDPIRAKATVGAVVTAGGGYLGRLPSAWILYFDHRRGEPTTVEEVLADPAAFDGKSLADPIEPDYQGRPGSVTPGKAKIYWNQDSQTVVIHSFAHGCGNFLLMHDAEGLVAAVKKMAASLSLDDLRLRWKEPFAMARDVDVDGRDVACAILEEVGIGKASDLHAELLDFEDLGDEDEAGDNTNTDKPKPQHKDSRAIVTVRPTDLPLAIREIEAACLKDEDAEPLLQQGGRYVRVEPLGRSGFNLKTDADGKNIPVLERDEIIPLDQTAAMFRIVTSVRLMKMKRDLNSGKMTAFPIKPTKELLIHFLNAPRKAAPTLHTVVNHPIATPDGRIIDKAGFDAETGILMTFGADFGRIESTKAKAQHALDEIKRIMFYPYKFTTPLDEAAAVCAFLAMVNRPLMGTAPIVHADATKQESGKTNLLKAIIRVSTGRAAAVTSPTKNEQEIGKFFTSVLMGGVPGVVLDNLPQAATQDSGNVAAFSTSDEWMDRLLGGNKVAALQNTLWLGTTGNRIQFSGDLASRVLPINLDKRKYSDETLPAYEAKLMANRADLIRHALTLVHHHFNDGSYKRPDTRSRFDVFDELCRFPVHRLTGLDVYDKMQQLKETTPAEMARVDVLRLVRELFGSGSFYMSDLVSVLRHRLNNDAYGLIMAAGVAEVPKPHEAGFEDCNLDEVAENPAGPKGRRTFHAIKDELESAVTALWENEIPPSGRNQRSQMVFEDAGTPNKLGQLFRMIIGVPTGGMLLVAEAGDAKRMLYRIENG